MKNLLAPLLLFGFLAILAVGCGQTDTDKGKADPVDAKTKVGSPPPPPPIPPLPKNK